MKFFSLSPSFPLRHPSLELSFSRIMHANMLQRLFRDFYSTKHMQHLPWPAFSLDISPIEHVWDLVGRRLARDPCPAASKDELLLRIQQYGILFHKQTFKICSTPCHVV
ncbi:uncharacterized protein TNCV_3321191 [Trichonephila clavipes]|nr:uncharacterized protein TNCV_3321191 [Trichonephila clavipes]